MIKTIEIPFNLTLSQVEGFNQLLRLGCDFYNSIVIYSNNYYSKFKKTINKFELLRMVKDVKNEIPECKYIHSHLLQVLVTRFCYARTASFEKFKTSKRLGLKAWYQPPLIKNYLNFNTLWFKELGNGNKILENNKVKFNHLKLSFKKNPKIYGSPKYLGITRRNNKFFLLVCTEINEFEEINNTKNILNNYSDIKKVSSKPEKTVGIDLGVKTYLYVSDGTYYDNPKLINKHQDKINNSKKLLEFKTKGSKRYLKQQARIAKHYDKLRNVRKDLIHKISKDLVTNYDIIVFEDLSIIQMMKDNFRVLNKHISNCAWNRLVLYARYKANMYKKEVILIDPRGTTQQCSKCLEMVPKYLKDREHKCSKCGSEIDRDYNASLNILRKGLEARNGPSS